MSIDQFIDSVHGNVITIGQFYQTGIVKRLKIVPEKAVLVISLEDNRKHVYPIYGEEAIQFTNEYGEKMFGKISIKFNEDGTDDKPPTPFNFNLN